MQKQKNTPVLTLVLLSLALSCDVGPYLCAKPFSYFCASSPTPYKLLPREPSK